MPFFPSDDADTDRARRRLRARIGRQRRRINQSVGAVSKQGRRLTDWRTYVRRFPLPTMALAFGAGLAISVAFRPAFWIRLLAGQLIGTAWGAVRADIRRDVRRFGVSLLRSTSDKDDHSLRDST